MTIGLVIGAVLVQETDLGAAYFLDPKVIASFISWGFYVLLLLVRRSAGLRGRRAAYVSGAVLVAMMVVGPLTFSATCTGSVPNDAGSHWRQPKTAPIALRERVAISRDDLPETTRALADTPGVWSA